MTKERPGPAVPEERVTPGTIVAFAIVVLSVGTLVWAAWQGLLPDMNRTLAKTVVGPIVLVAVLGLALVVGMGVDRMLGIRPPRKTPDELPKR